MKGYAPTRVVYRELSPAPAWLCSLALLNKKTRQTQGLSCFFAKERLKGAQRGERTTKSSLIIPFYRETS